MSLVLSSNKPSEFALPKDPRDIRTKCLSRIRDASHMSPCYRVHICLDRGKCLSSSVVKRCRWDFHNNVFISRVNMLRETDMRLRYIYKLVEWPLIYFMLFCFFVELKTVLKVDVPTLNESTFSTFRSFGNMLMTVFWLALSAQISLSLYWLPFHIFVPFLPVCFEVLIFILPSACYEEGNLELLYFLLSDQYWVFV